MYENKEKVVLESVVLSSNASQVANSELGITQEYNKANRDRLWDSQKGKANFKEKQFGDRNTYEDACGKYMDDKIKLEIEEKDMVFDNSKSELIKDK